MDVIVENAVIGGHFVRLGPILIDLRDRAAAPSDLNSIGSGVEYLAADNRVGAATRAQPNARRAHMGYRAPLQSTANGVFQLDGHRRPLHRGRPVVPGLDPHVPPLWQVPGGVLEPQTDGHVGFAGGCRTGTAATAGQSGCQ